MSILLHMSDTHFGTEKPAVVAALRGLARERRPDVLVFSGDVTQRATPAQFAAARRLCDDLEITPMLALPGNHDIPLFNLLSRLTAALRQLPARLWAAAGAAAQYRRFPGDRRQHHARGPS